MKDYIKGLLLWLVAVALYFPSVVTDYLGTAYGGFWDFYESSFMIITLIAFIPMFLAGALFRGPVLLRAAFSITAAWSMLFAIPDVFLSYFPPYLLQTQGLGFMGDYHAWWFGNTSIVLLACNFVTLYALRDAEIRIFKPPELKEISA